MNVNYFKLKKGSKLPNIGTPVIVKEKVKTSKNKKKTTYHVAYLYQEGKKLVWRDVFYNPIKPFAWAYLT